MFKVQVYSLGGKLFLITNVVIFQLERLKLSTFRMHFSEWSHFKSCWSVTPEDIKVCVMASDNSWPAREYIIDSRGCSWRSGGSSACGALGGRKPALPFGPLPPGSICLTEGAKPSEAGTDSVIHNSFNIDRFPCQREVFSSNLYFLHSVEQLSQAGCGGIVKLVRILWNDMWNMLLVL